MDTQRNKRVGDLFSWKMRYMFKDVLGIVEKETKDYDVDKEFFDNKEKKGFLAIRKIFFDHGNAIIDLVKILMDELELVPKKSIVQLKDGLIEKIKKEEGVKKNVCSANKNNNKS